MAALCTFYSGNQAPIDHTPSGALAAGDVVDLGDIVGIAITDIAANTLGALGTEGLWTVPKKTSEVWVKGEPIYWDAGTSSFTHTSSYSEATAGFAAAAAASGDATGIVKLDPGVARS